MISETVQIPTEVAPVRTTQTKEKTRAPKSARSPVNVGRYERMASGLGGAGLVYYGLSRRGIGGYVLALAGAGLVRRGLTGHCSVYRAVGINRVRAAAGGVEQGIKVERSVVVNRPLPELYSFWRNFENLPKFMKHLESVRCVGDKYSHWTAKAPLGMNVEWGAALINEVPNELIAWESLPEADVRNAGSVHFRSLAGERGTEVRVSLQYLPPAGKLGAAVARWFGGAPEQQVEEDLRRFKTLMEAGELPAIDGQPQGRCGASQAPH